MRKVSLEVAREICADGTYFPNNLRIIDRIIYLLVKIIINMKLIHATFVLVSVMKT